METKTKTEGARLLGKKVEKFGRSMVMLGLKISDSTLDHCLKGRRKPTLDLAVKIQQVFRISVVAWTIPPKK